MRILGRDIDVTMTPVVAYGLIFLMAIFAAVGFESYAASIRDMKDTVQSLKADHDVLERIKDDTVWAERLAESENIRQDADAAVWMGETSGIIAAEVSQTLRKFTAPLDLKNVNIRVDTTPTDSNGTQVLYFQYVASVPHGKGVVDVLAGMSNEQRSIVILEADFGHLLRDKLATRLAISGVVPIKIVGSATNTPADAQGRAN